MKRIQRIRQQGLELVGRGDKTDALTENLSQIERKVEGIRNGCQVTTKKLASSLQGSGSTLEKHQKRIPLHGLGVEMREAGVKLRQEDPTSLFGNVLQMVGQAETDISSQIADYEVVLNNDVITSLNAMLEEDTKKVDKTRKKLQNARLDMDSTRGRLKSAEAQAEKSSREYQMGKLDTLRTELDEATKKFEDCQDAYATAMFSFMGRERDYTEKLQEFVRRQIVMFKMSVASLEGMLPTIEKRISESQVRPIFGMALEEHLKLSKREIAVVIEDCVTALRDQWMDTEGLFRIAGSSAKVKFLVNSFNAQQRNAYDHDPHTISGCLKRYLRELPDPLLTSDLYQDWMKAVQVQDYNTSMQQMKDLLQQLPEGHINNLKYLLAFLHEFSQYQETTKMSISNIAIVIGPNLLWPHQESSDAASVVADTALQRRVAELLIEHVHWFFPDLPETPAPVIPNRTNSYTSSHGTNFSGTYTSTVQVASYPTAPPGSPGPVSTPSSASSTAEEPVSQFSPSSSLPASLPATSAPPQDPLTDKQSSPKGGSHTPPIAPKPYRGQNSPSHLPVAGRSSFPPTPIPRSSSGSTNTFVSSQGVPTGSDTATGSVVGGYSTNGVMDGQRMEKSASLERGLSASRALGDDPLRPSIPVRKKRRDPESPKPTTAGGASPQSTIERKGLKGPSRKAPPPPVSKRSNQPTNGEEVSSL